MADLDVVLAAAGISPLRWRFAPSWPSCGALAAFGEQPDHLTASAVETAALRQGMSPVQIAELVAGLSLFSDRPELRALAVHARWMFANGVRLDGTDDWPMLDRAVHAAAPLFWAYVVLACIDLRVDLNRGRGIPDEVTRASFQDLGRWLDVYRSTRGHAGFDRAGWLHWSVQGTLIELGRLQCNCTAWEGQQRVFRHRRNGRVAIQMTAGAAMRADGRHQGIAGLPADPEGWVATTEDGPDGWRGHAVDDRGRAERTSSLLPATDWEPALAPGDPVWYVHIPPSGPLTGAVCRDSLIAHRLHLPRWFPDHRAKAFISVSWLFDGQLADYLPADANLIRFQRAFRLHPVLDVRGDQIRERVLGRFEADWRTVTPTSSLQRAVVEHYRSGGTWCKAGAVLFPDQVETAFS